MYFKNNQTYDMTHKVKGYYIDFLNLLSESMNFTFTLYKRKDGIFGQPYALNNGSVTATGMLANLFDNSADVAWGPLAFTASRAPYIDFLTPFADSYGSIFIKNELPEDLDFFLYFMSFELDLWVMLISLAILLTIFSQCIDNNSNNVISNFWKALMMNFGGKSIFRSEESLPMKIISLSSLLCGVCIWMSYRASFTSSLSIRKAILPFNDWYTFSQTNYL